MLFFLFLLTYPPSISTENDDFLPQGKTEFSILTNDIQNHSLLVDNIDVPSKLGWSYATTSGSRIEVYDNILTENQQMMLRVLSSYRIGSWSYRIPEQHVKNGQNHVSRNNKPWYNELDCKQLFETVTGKQLKKVVQNFVGNEEYIGYEIVAHIMRRGDFPTVHVDASHEDDEVSMMIYLNPKWKKNDYGDLFLYDEDNEIVAGIIPQQGRVIVWQSSIPYLTKPPSVALKTGQLFLRISFTKNLTKVKHRTSQWLQNKNSLKAIHNKGILDPARGKEVEIQTHMVSKKLSKDGKKIFVFDELFDRDVLDDLRSKILNYGVYYYDDSYDNDSDNVQWIAGFDQIDPFVRSNLWKTVQEVAIFVSDGAREWFPYDVACNLIRNTDTTQLHDDCSVEEDEWTFLLYLNPEWTVNHYGETVYYEDNDEIITAVLPKYGRVVIFQGIIPHSARPPSSTFTGVRLSFAVKLSQNEWIARIKALRERMRHLTGLRTVLGSFQNKYEKNEDEENIKDFGNIETVNDVVMNELESKLETLITAERQDIEELCLLISKVRERHLKTFDEMEQLLHEIL